MITSGTTEARTNPHTNNMLSYNHSTNASRQPRVLMSSWYVNLYKYIGTSKLQFLLRERIKSSR